MSLYIDLKYINYISSRLPLFTRKSDYLFNFRCTICGDSANKKNKARGYFYRVKNEMFMKCHNCSASLHFGSFLKQTDQMLYSQYALERYADGAAPNKPHKDPQLKFKEPVVPTKQTLLDDLLDRVDTLPEDHIAVQFCKKRKIPESKYSRLYFIDNMKNIEQLSDKMKDKIKTSESRLVIPFYDETLQLTGMTCRALDNNSLRYITVKIKSDELLVFGRESLNTEKDIYVTEGPIDSLFLDNSIAVSGTGFNKLELLPYSKDSMIIIVDNQPRNVEVCKVIENLVNKNYRIVIWPQSLKEKDINDIILNGKSISAVKSLIDKNVCRGLQARANFLAWKRC